MNDNQKSKKLEKHLASLGRKKLVALASQRTDLSYQEILGLGNKALVETLARVPDVLKPVQA